MLADRLYNGRPMSGNESLSPNVVSADDMKAVTKVCRETLKAGCTDMHSAEHCSSGYGTGCC